MIPIKFFFIPSIFIMIFTGCTTKENSLKPLTVKFIKKTYRQVDRIENIAYSILISNKTICSKKYNNYASLFSISFTQNLSVNDNNVYSL